ncbi:macrophage migration inhibitory factor [Ancylostoma duodenale]|uniref:Macrophage migration inhibitory factor n=1 Tax=Ancylostoma duodenale TaxID=51022 RepID=A0A0C2CFR8_9BILA|nr:macrophage migration inhibitory factor [Ancylostoma duodenale]
MPMVRVATNLPDEDVPTDFEERLTDLLAESLNRPRKNFFIEVLTGQRITHGASRSPVAVIKVGSVPCCCSVVRALLGFMTSKFLRK